MTTITPIQHRNIDHFRLASGLEIPVMGIGTWKMGGVREKDTSHDKEYIAAIKAAIAAGLRHIDTAELYGNGHAEELVAEAMHNVKGVRRADLFITSKVMWQHLKYDEVIAACKKTLERLKTDYVDLYLLHSPNPNVAITETMHAMEYLVENNLIRFIGVSNFSVAQLQEAQKYCKHKIVANQIEYSLIARDAGLFTKNMESEIIPYCQEHGILVISWRTLAYGLLTKSDQFPVLDEIAKKYNKTPAQVALNWCLSKNIAIIPKMISLAHIEENLGALGWKMSEEDSNALELGFIKYKNKYHRELMQG